MIQPLRTVHQRTFVALALSLPAILITGLGWRRPQEFRASAVRSTKTETTPWHNRILRSDYEHNSDNPRTACVILRLLRELNEPDLLVYWTPASVQDNSLPSHASLLGSYAPGIKFALQPKQRSGNLVLYSLAHQKVLDYAAVESLP